jgi:hypothetical protein
MNIALSVVCWYTYIEGEIWNRSPPKLDADVQGATAELSRAKRPQFPKSQVQIRVARDKSLTETIRVSKTTCTKRFKWCLQKAVTSRPHTMRVYCMRIMPHQSTLSINRFASQTCCEWVSFSLSFPLRCLAIHPIANECCASRGPGSSRAHVCARVLSCTHRTAPCSTGTIDSQNISPSMLLGLPTSSCICKFPACTQPDFSSLGVLHFSKGLPYSSRSSPPCSRAWIGFRFRP